MKLTINIEADDQLLADVWGKGGAIPLNLSLTYDAGPVTETGDIGAAEKALTALLTQVARTASQMRQQTGIAVAKLEEARTEQVVADIEFQEKYPEPVKGDTLRNGIRRAP